MPKPSTLISDAFGTLVVRMIGIALMFVSTTVSARLLGPAEYGAYTAALALAILLATLAPMGSDRILVRSLSTAKCLSERGRETAIAHLCTAITAVILLCAALVSWVINDQILDNHSLARTSLLAAFMFVPQSVTYLRQWVAIPLIGARRAVMPEQTLVPVLFMAAILFVAGTGFRVTALTASTSYFVVLLLVWAGSVGVGSLRATYRSAWNTFPQIRQLPVRARILEGIPFVSVAIGAVWTQTCTPLIIAMTCGFDDTACYALAMPYAALPAIPLSVFNLIMIPRCARYFRNREFAEANHAVRSAATVTFVLAAVIGGSVWICSPWLITVLGKQYSMTCRLLPPLLLAALVDCLTGPTIPVMQTMSLEKTYTRTLFAFIPIHLGLIYFFSRVAGIEGAALGYLLSRCVWNVVVVTRIYQLRRLVMLPYLSFQSAFTEESRQSPDEPSEDRPKQGLLSAFTF